MDGGGGGEGGLQKHPHDATVSLRAKLSFWMIEPGRRSSINDIHNEGEGVEELPDFEGGGMRCR